VRLTILDFAIFPTGRRHDASTVHLHAYTVAISVRGKFRRSVGSSRAGGRSGAPSPFPRPPPVPPVAGWRVAGSIVARRGGRGRTLKLRKISENM
jgi:hypothetical protein